MNTLYFLYTNRERPTTLKRGFVLLIKRLLLFWPLMKIVFKQKKLKGKGAIVGRLTIIGEAKIEGRDLSSLSIGEQSSIGRSEITLHNKVNIGKNVVINDGVILLTATHRLTDPKWTLKSAPITVNDYAWIATNAIILPGVTIGKGAVVGAGAVVREDVPDYAIVFGNPAEIVEGRQRTNNLDYSPVLFNAPYEAWIGKNLDE
jgi:acetyltransferase-like isoleucine patch superfamily enzyme